MTTAYQLEFVRGPFDGARFDTNQPTTDYVVEWKLGSCSPMTKLDAASENNDRPARTALYRFCGARFATVAGLPVMISRFEFQGFKTKSTAHRPQLSWRARLHDFFSVSLGLLGSRSSYAAR